MAMVLVHTSKSKKNKMAGIHQIIIQSFLQVGKKYLVKLELFAGVSFEYLRAISLNQVSSLPKLPKSW